MSAKRTLDAAGGVTLCAGMQGRALPPATLPPGEGGESRGAAPLSGKPEGRAVEPRHRPSPEALVTAANTWIMTIAGIFRRLS